jgi:transposase
MNKMDGRKLGHETLEQMRIRAVQQVVAGMSPEVVVAAMGFHRSRIYRWLALYREGGIEALKARKAKGPEPKLSGNQLEKLYRLITGHSPLQLSFEFALWTRAMVRELIRKQFKVRLSDVSVGRLLRNMGLSPQKPLYRAYQRDEEKVKAWKEEAYPEIRKVAKQEGATIYFGDEASVRSDYHSGTTWAPIGETPQVESSGARFSVQMISVVSAKGQMRFMTFTGKMNADTFIEFLKRLIYKADKPIFLVLDGHPVHRSRKVKEYVATTNGRLRLFVLPPYSPHLNPDEWVWSWLKSHRLGRATVSGSDQFRAMVNRYLTQLQKLPGVIRGFFGDKNLAYIHS